MATQRFDGDRKIDLEEVAKLVLVLEHDVAKAQTGSTDIQALRDEVEALRRLLNASAPDNAQVGDRLRTIRSILPDTLEIVIDDAKTVAEYIARIGRMLGM